MSKNYVEESHVTTDLVEPLVQDGRKGKKGSNLARGFKARNDVS